MSKKTVTESQKRQIKYMTKVLSAIQEGCFDEEAENPIDLQEFDDPKKLTEFIHVIANALPNQLYGQLTGARVNNLEFNHIANKLCFQFNTKQD